MQFFKCYQREISTFVLISLLQSFVFEIFVAYSKPISSSGYFYVPILTQDNQANTGNKQREEGNQTLNYVDLLAVDPSNVMLQYEATTSDGTSKLEKNQKQVDESTIIYAADIVYGVIGVDASIPFDNPEDNLFKVMIADQIDQQATYVLSYDLNGASSAVEVAKSINTTTSIGGYLQRKNTTWTRVEEYVSPANLRQGVNTILFTADLEVTSLYKVRNLQIEKRLENKQIDAIQVNEAVRDSLTGKVYISGIVPIQEGAELYISGQRIPIEHHTFEYVEELDKALTQPLKVEFRQENEKVIAQEISLDTAKKASYTKTLQAAFERHEFEVKKGKGSGVYEHGKVKIEVPSGSFADDFTLSIQELRPSDYAPTGMGLTNVTANQGAYRFLPDGIQFDQEVILTIPYDVATLPIGYSAKDIQVFYFDTKIKQWAQVKVIDVLEASQQVVAITNHFTDYLAGVIQEPESPDGEAFTPTTLSGIHAVNPTENVPMISVPQINDQGDAVLQFPLMLPQGRHGMTPNIAMTYNSSADEGDFGLGWSLSVPTIAVDIRWGVPLYDGIKETESYIFNGDELLLVQSNQTLYAPHKDPLTNRVTNVVFQTAQHNPNLEIKRLGSLNNYTWQVTDYITGWISEYSTYARGKWYLTKVTDPYENFMEYSYNQNASGDYQLKTITYNRHQSLETGSYGTFATFTVDIFRKNTIDSPRGPRKDVKLNNRYGVESKSIDLIDKIIIKNEPKSAHITTDKGDISLGHVENEYKFLYKAGQFSRSLLYKIVNTNLNNYTRGNQGILPPDIQEYSFDYHDDIGSGGLFESTGKTIQTYKDYVTDYDRFGVYISALGGTEGKSTNFNGGGSAGIVTPIFPNSWLPFSRAATVGGNLGGGTSNTETKVMMTDIDGDGLPDKVFKDGKKFYYRKNIGDKFSLDTYPIKNLPNLSYSKSKSSDLGFSVNVFVGNISRSNAKSASTTSTYMTDVNADGLLDVVDNERVYFGYIDPQTRTPSFSLDSSITPVIVLKEEDVAPVLNPAPQVDMTNGPMDMVMVWRAPKPGQIKVTGTIGKRYVALQNGVKFSIERLNASDLMGTASFILGPNLMLSTRENHNHTLTVEKGDLLFFRVHTNQIPVEELGVTWNPKVEYIGVNPDPVMTSSRHVSTYEEGFIVGASMEHVFKEAKKYQLEWPRFIFQDKDRITIRVSYFKKGTNTGGNIPIIGNNVVIYEKTSTINEPFDFQNFNRIIDASSVTSVPSSYHYLKIEVLSDSEINWKEVDQRFKPKLKVLGSNEPDIYLTPYYSNYSKVHTSYVPIQFTGNGPEVTITIKNNFSLPACTQETCNDRYVYLVARRANGSIIKLVSGSADNSAGYIKFRYKFDATGRIVQKQRLNAHDVYENLGDTFTMVFDNVPGDKYFFEYYTTENKIGELVDAYQAYTGTNPPPPLIKITARRATPATYMTGVDNEGRVKANVYTSEPTTTWGPMYRNWGQFAYKGADVDQPYEAIVGKNIQMFNTTENTGNVTQDLLSNPGVSLDQVEQDMDEIQRLGGNMSVYFGMLLPNKKTNRWESHEHLYVAVNGISPYLRFLTDDIPDLRPPAVPVGNYGAFGINKYGSFKNNSTSKSIGFLGLSVGGTKTEGSSELLNEFMDINGDGFPDIIGERIQLTAKRGGLSSRIVQADFTIRTSIEGKGSLVGGGSAGITGSPKLGDKATRAANLYLKVGNQATAAASSVKFMANNTSSRFYVDINGDGLLDIVQSNGKVLLNYGGVFRESSIWQSLPLQASRTITKNGAGGGGAGLGFSSQSNLDISLGLSISESTSDDRIIYMDLNGDGLPEKIDGTKYYINTGLGFESTGHNLPGVQSQKAIEAGINGNLTVCVYFPLPFILTGPKFCVSGGGAMGRNISSEQGRYLDFDGDGNMDYVTSKKNESITVYKSRIKRTNLLKTVTQSTGSKIVLDYNVVNPLDQSTIGSTYKMPYKKWALTKVSVHDAFEGDGQDVTRYAYEYFNGYKDRKERKFLGFGMTKSHLLDARGIPYRTQVTEYLINEMKESELYQPGISSALKQYIYKKGLPKSIATLDKRQRALTEKEYRYKFYNSRELTMDVATTTTSNAEVRTFTEKMSILPLVTNTTELNWEYQNETGTTALLNKQYKKFAVYDKRGNVKKYLDESRDLTVDINYNLGRRTLPISHRISTTNSNQQLRLTKATLTDNEANYAEISKYSSITEASTIKYEYNGLGNLVKKILPGGFTYQYAYDFDLDNFNQGQYTGDYFKIVPTKVIDPLGNTTKIYPSPFGLPIIVMDKYGEQVRYQYDALNRLSQAKGPYDVDWVIRNKYLNNRTAITQHNLGNGDILHTSILTDGLGRVVQMKKQLATDDGYEPCEQGQPKFRFAVSGKNIYDEFGRVVTNYLSEEELYCDDSALEEAGLIDVPPEEVLQTLLTTYYRTTNLDERKISTSYDNRDRVLDQMIYGSDALTQNVYGYQENLVTHKRILPQGNTTITYYDRLGQIAQTQQLGNSQTLTTKFSYDPLGQTEEVVNAANHFVKYQYDLLGRITQKKTSASGITTFEYDNLGQIKKSKDANNRTTTYQYNFNRLTQVRGIGIDTDFVYEQEGRLKRMDDQTGYHEFKYGKLGEIVEDMKMVKDVNGIPRYFKTKYKYDSWGRILEKVYPDKEKLRYTYNAVGQLKSIENTEGFSYLSEVKYNYFDQPYFIRYGNKVELVQEFDMTERLRAAQLGLPILEDSANQSIFSRNVYTYDRNNNIRGVYNNFTQNGQIQIGGKLKKHFIYDAFNRLDFAEGEWDGLIEKHHYTLKMEYNKDHSLAQKNQKHQVYDRNTRQTTSTENATNKKYFYSNADLPQLTRIENIAADGGLSNQVFKYAPNGNVELILLSGNGGQHRVFTWDANNNITSILEGNTGMESRYLYDGTGKRIAKRVTGNSALNINGGNSSEGMYGTNEVLYPTEDLVYTAKQYTKHYYANSKRIASRITKSYETGYFAEIQYNKEVVSPHTTTNSNGMRSSRITVASRGERQIGMRNIALQTSLAICQNQIEFLLHSVHEAPEHLECKLQLLQIIEESSSYETRCTDTNGQPITPCQRVRTNIDYCLALELINVRGCIKSTSDGWLIDPSTGNVYNPVTGLPSDPITREPIDIGTIGDGGGLNHFELDCYNRFINFIEYYKDRNDKPKAYDDLIQYYECLTCVKCEKDCDKLPLLINIPSPGTGAIKTESGKYIFFCMLHIPDIVEEEVVIPEPDFPPVILEPGVEDTWVDVPPSSSPIVIDQTISDPIWWYHNDHLGSTSYITDVTGKPCQYIEYLPFGERMVEQSTNNILENVYKFNGKELDAETGYYYYGARYYDPGTSIFLSVDPLAEQYPGWNPYHYVHNNPINLIDPTGMAATPPTDYFNSHGVFERSVNDGNNAVKIFASNTNRYVSPSQLSSSSGSYKAVLRMAMHYRKQMGVSNEFKLAVGPSPRNKESSRNPAFTTVQGVATINNKGGFSSALDDSNSFMNVMRHENGHQLDFANKVKTDLKTHAEVYLYQMNDDSFRNSPDDFKVGIMKSFGNYLLNMDQSSDYNNMDIWNAIDAFNELGTGGVIKQPGNFAKGTLNLQGNYNNQKVEIKYEKVEN